MALGPVPSAGRLPALLPRGAEVLCLAPSHHDQPVDRHLGLKVAVDDYLAFCAERGEEPDKLFSGRFVVRLAAEDHRRVYLAAKKAGRSLASWVADALRRAAGG